MTAALGPIAAVRLVSADADRLATFYADAFGFERLPAPEEATPDAAARLLGVAAAAVRTVRLRLGRQHVELIEVSPAGRPYPAGAGSADTVFQHIAFVVADMDAAVARLAAVGGATAISAGPQVLPASSGGVTAYKFRDPEGHPLEFLKFPRPPAVWAAASGGPCLGFDHSAITVADTAASVAFYRRLGLERSGGSLNAGVEQARLDAVPDAVVEVTALGAIDAPPHVELLRYRAATARTATAANDVAATQLAFAVPDRATLVALAEAVASHVVSAGVVDLGVAAAAVMLADPDGHRLLLHTTPRPVVIKS